MSKKLAALAGLLGLSASEESEAGPFYHASRYLFDRPRAIGPLTEMGQNFGPGFYGLDRPDLTYYEHFRDASRNSYAYEALEEALRRAPPEGGENVYDLSDLFNPRAFAIGDQRLIDQYRNRTLKRNPEYRPIAEALDDILSEKPYKNDINLYEFEFDDDLPLIDYDSPIKENLITKDKLLTDAWQDTALSDEAPIGMLMRELAEDKHYFGPEKLIKSMLELGWRGTRHVDDATDLPGYTMFAPELDLELINRRIIEGF